jgi:hypothetical protein
VGKVDGVWETEFSLKSSFTRQYYAALSFGMGPLAYALLRAKSDVGAHIVHPRVSLSRLFGKRIEKTSAEEGKVHSSTGFMLY